MSQPKHHTENSTDKQIKTHQTPAGELRYYEQNGHRIAVDNIDADFSSINNKGIKQAIFGDRVDTKYHTTQPSELKVAEMTVTDDVIDMVKRKQSQYEDNWGARDDDKSNIQIKWAQYIGHMAEYVIDYMADSSTKMMQEINDSTNQNQGDFMDMDGNTYDVKTVNTFADGSNHTMLKWDSGTYMDKHTTHQMLRNKKADAGIHAYVAGIDEDGNRVQTDKADVTDLQKIIVAIEMTINYNKVCSDLIQNYGSVTDDPYLTLFSDEVAFAKRAWIYENGYDIDPSSI